MRVPRRIARLLVVASLVGAGSLFAGVANAAAHDLHDGAHAAGDGAHVSTGAHTELTRSYDWAIHKTVNRTELTLAVGQSYDVEYSVAVTRTAVDSGFRAFDGITLDSPSPVTVTSVSDVVSTGITAAVSCPVSFPWTGKQLQCTFTAAVPDASPRVNTATITLDDGHELTATSPVDFSTATVQEINPCVDVTDSLAGPLGQACASKTFTYTSTIGPYTVCGEYTVENTAWLAGHDPLHPTGGSSTALVHVHVPCPTGCTRTIGYWKNHAGFGPQADVLSQYLPIWLGTAGGARSVNVTTAAQAVSLLSMSGDASNGVNKLYAQLLAAKLNIASGADGSAIAGTISQADALLATTSAASWAGLTKSQRQTILALASRLDAYNNGLVGPPHCDE